MNGEGRVRVEWRAREVQLWGQFPCQAGGTGCAARRSGRVGVVFAHVVATATRLLTKKLLPGPPLRGGLPFLECFVSLTSAHVEGLGRRLGERM